jgi:omega-6 fatty acid desaturase (delta-12 desaturase)
MGLECAISIVLTNRRIFTENLRTCWYEYFSTRQEAPMLSESPSSHAKESKPAWYHASGRFVQPDLRKAVVQLLTTFIPYFGIWGLMLQSVNHQRSYWLALAMAVVAGLLLVRIFIIFHDCCHNSFVTSHQGNRILGYVTGILTFTAYEDWQRTHGIHHATAGDLDRRGVGDVWTMTVKEYRSAPLIKRVAYRLYRNPLVFLVPISTALFLVVNRFASSVAKKSQHRSVLITNLGLLVILALAGLTIGFRAYLMVQVPIIIIAGGVGVWLFYVQHQFQGVYWARHSDWDPMKVAMEGSSYYKLPQIVQWLTGNIGLHHIHHIRPRIPNYNLQACYDSIAELQAVQPLSFHESLKSLWLNLYDEEHTRLVSFQEAKGLS